MTTNRNQAGYGQHRPHRGTGLGGDSVQNLILAGGLGLLGYLLIRWLSPSVLGPAAGGSGVGKSHSFGMVGGHGGGGTSTWAGGKGTQPGRARTGIGDGIEGESSVPVMGTAARGPSVRRYD